MITSIANPQVKRVVQLQKKARLRREEGLFVVEGPRMFREVPRERLEKVYVSSGYLTLPEHREQLAGMDWEEVEDKVFARMSDTQSPQGVLCLVRQREDSLDSLLEREAPLLLVLEDIQDPGNLGTIFRTAEGAGVHGIIMSRGCADIYNPKTIRSTMGSIYRVPFCVCQELSPALDRLEQAGVRTYAAHLQGKNTYDPESYLGGTAFLIGNEGNGLSPEVSARAACRIRIPMEGQLESLNAGVAAAILMYEAGRQRRNVSTSSVCHCPAR